MKSLLAAALTCALIVGMSVPAFAHNSDDHGGGGGGDSGPSKSACVKEADAARKLAIDNAQEDFKQARLVCAAGSVEKAACIQSCVQARKECAQPINDGIESCRDAAELAFKNSRDACIASVACGNDCPGNAAFQECMVPARATFFTSMKACKGEDDKAGKRACNATMRTCIAACQ